MAPPPDLETLAQSVVLRGLPPAELEALRPKPRRRSYKRGEVVFRQGDPGHALYVVTEGRLKVVLPAESGEEAILNVLGPGDVLGELALLVAQPRSATTVALEPVGDRAGRDHPFGAPVRIARFGLHLGQHPRGWSDVDNVPLDAGPRTRPATGEAHGRRDDCHGSERHPARTNR